MYRAYRLLAWIHAALNLGSLMLYFVLYPRITNKIEQQHRDRDYIISRIKTLEELENRYNKRIEQNDNK